jgi:hypothetical protein
MFQPDCSLLINLAPELRLLIWEMVVGGMRIHIIQRPNRRMGHIVCSHAETCDICSGNVPQLAKDEEARRKTQLLSLALTCKLM